MIARVKTIELPGCLLTSVSPSSIEVGTRFREDMGDLSDLKHSIKTQGLINPISVTAKEDGTFLLVAGGRRLQACLELGLPEVPVRVFEKCDELSLRLLELAENIQRKDMSWQEQNRLQREIHLLQQRIHGGAQNWSIRDTASMLGVSKSTVGESLALGEKMERYKEVLGDQSKYKTENDARRAVKSVEESIIRNELAKRAAARQREGDAISMLANLFQVGDCLEAMSKLPPSSFDFAEVDPPYGINLNEVKAENSCEGYTEVEQEQYLVFSRKVLEATYNLLKPNSYCIYWFGIDPWLEYLYKVAREVGFEGTRIPLIWAKTNGQSLNPSATLANCYETAFVLKKGSPILARPGRLNLFSYPVVASQDKHHPTQKPLDLYRDIYETFSFEGASCLVPFAGSGASLLAAFLTKRKSIGWDLNPEYKGGYIQMLQKELLQ